MGVSFLPRYVREVGALHRVKMSDEVKQYRDETGKPPVIVVDGINIMITILRNYELNTFECRLLDYVKHLKEFISKFKDLGIRLVFYFDGCNWMQNVGKWVDRRRQGIREVHSIFDCINLDDTSAGKTKISLLSNIWNTTVHNLIQEGCETWYSVEDCDAEIVFFAKENNCMGILAGDSDFFINTPCNVYWTQEIDLKSMECLKFDRNKLLKSLCIEECLLPLLATLFGNDIIPYGSLAYQNKRRGAVNVSNYCNFVTCYVKSLNIQNEISDTILKKISSDFGVGSDDEVIRLKASLESYKINPPCIEMDISSNGDKNWEAILKTTFSNLKNNVTSRVYAVIFLMTFQGSEKVEDFREKDLPPVYSVTKELRRKVYGILLHEKPGECQPVIEMLVTHPTIFSPEPVFPIFPQVDHPGLLALWGNGDLELEKWILLADAFGVDHKELQKIPRILIVPALAMKYLVGKMDLPDWEIKAAILSAVITSFLSLSDLSEMSLSRVQSRNIRLCTLINEVYAIVIFMLDALGGPLSCSEYLPTNYQYGVVYHIVYKMMRYGNSPSYIINSGFSLKESVKCEKQFQCISLFVFTT